MASSLPARVGRLFSHYDCDRLARSNRCFVLARILEYGDSEDFAWLLQSVPETELRQWFETHGYRQLSRRSFAFWHWLLSSRPEVPPLPENPLWPL